MTGGWIGVDLDGTLAEYSHWQGVDNIGAPIRPMVRRVQNWLREGKRVKIFTARVGGSLEEAALARPHIERWCSDVFGIVLPVTALKDYGMIELWDDRAVQVEVNTGRRMDGVPDPLHWTP